MSIFDEKVHILHLDFDEKVHKAILLTIHHNKKGEKSGRKRKKNGENERLREIYYSDFDQNSHTPDFDRKSHIYRGSESGVDTEPGVSVFC